MLRGSCLCGGVRFEVRGAVHEMGNCHCAQFRKAYGSAFGTIAVVSRDDFAYTSGRELIASFKATERVTRYHCRNCGSPLPICEDWDTLVGIPAGLLDDDPGCKPSSHIFVGSKAPWWDIADEQPQFEAWPPAQDMNERAKKLRGEGTP
jgi:hypothetical protein